MVTESIIGSAAFVTAYYERYGFFPHVEGHAPRDGECHTVESFEALPVGEKVEVIDALNARP